MHTGYDNFWMHSNNRHKPVLNLPKIDNRSHAQLTDNYKQVQSGGCPGSLNSFIPSQNIAASSCENDQYRKSYDQSMWPSSVYSLPFMSSHANNFHSQEPLIAPTSNFVYSTVNSHSQEKYDFRHFEIPNGNGTANAPPPYSTNTNYHGCSAQVQTNKNNNAQLPRIRVKDVFSLNNSTIPNELEVDSSSFQTQHKEPQENSSDFTVVLHSRSLGSQTQEEYTSYRKYSLSESSKPPPYELTATRQSHLKNQEQFFQHSVPFQQQSANFSSKNFEFDGGRQTECNLSLETLESTPNFLLRQLLSHENILAAEIQNCQREASNPLQGHGGVKMNQKTNLSVLNDVNDVAADAASRELNERLLRDYSHPRDVTRVHGNLRESTSKVDEANLIGHNFASNTTAKAVAPATARGSPRNEINNQQNCLIKITIPHTGESSFISLNDCGRTESSALNFLGINDEHCGLNRNTSDHNLVNNEQNVVSSSLPPQVGHRRASAKADYYSGSPLTDSGSDVRGNCVATDRGCMTSPLVNLDQPDREPHRQDPFTLISNAENNFYPNSAAAPENVQQDCSLKILSEEINIPKQEITLNEATCSPLTFKQENYAARTESCGTQRGRNILGEKVLNWTIKTEERSESLAFREQELGSPPSENSTTLPSDVRTHVEEPTGNSDCAKSKVISSTASEDCSNQTQTSKNNSSKFGDVPRPEKENDRREVAERREVDIPKRSYKSKINRDKLDLLIKFLKKDEEVARSNGSAVKDQHSSKTSNRDSEEKKEVDSNHNRRKLSKTHVVRNKNNSREMISLMSLKGSSCASKTSQITKPNKEVEKSEKRKSVCAKDGLETDKSVDVSKKPVKCNNPCPENETEKNESSLLETSDENACSRKEVKESSEKPPPEAEAQEEKTLVSAMKAFQNFKTHFCMSCNLMSSIDSFWINVVSGELRCLNCFKKMTLKAENAVKSTTHDASSVKPVRKSKAKEEALLDANHNSRDEEMKKRDVKCESPCRKSSDLKGNAKQKLPEVSGSTKHKARAEGEMACSSRRGSSGEGSETRKEKSSEEQKVLKAEKSVRGSLKSKSLESDSKKEMKNLDGKTKRKSLAGKEDSAERERSSSSIRPKKVQVMGSKEQVAGERAKEEKKADASPKARRSSDNAKEESRCHKVRSLEERSQKEVRQARHCAEEFAPKSLPGEDCSFRKDHAAEEATKRNVKHEPSEKTRTQNDSREGGDHQKPRTDKQFGPKDANSEGARKAPSSRNDLESQKRAEQSRKRKNSDEDFCVRKVHVVQDLTKRDFVHPVEVRSSKSLEAKVSKEGEASKKRKMSDSEKAGSRHSAEKPRSSSKEECAPSGERPRKESRPAFDSCGRTTTKESPKGHVAPQWGQPSERAKGKTSGPAESPRKESRDRSSERPADPKESDGSSRRGQVLPGGSKRRLSHEGGPGREAKRESFVSENEKRKKSEDDGKRSPEKIPAAVRTPSKDGQAPKPPKEGQNTKAGATTPKQKSKAQTM